MKVRELIAVLEDLDPEAAVYIMSQPNYPFEHAVSGVALREDFTDCDDEDEEEAEGEEEERPAPPRSLDRPRCGSAADRRVHLGGRAAALRQPRGLERAAVAGRPREGVAASGAAPPPAAQPAVSRRRA